MPLTNTRRRVPDGGEARDAPDWSAGTASTVITPEEPMRMAGFAAREGRAEGTETDLRAKAVAFEDRTGERTVVANAELLAVPRDVRETVAATCEDRHGLARSALLLNATHTHCGPEFRTSKYEVYDLSDEDRDRAAAYRERLTDALVDLVGRALDDLRPARLRYSHARCGFAMNRRLPTADGVRFEQNPDGPVDHDVPVLAVERAGADGDGDALRAVLFGYACHPTSLFIDRYCGDWAGYAQEYVEEAHPDATAVFVQGCAGDQKAYPQRELHLAERHGRSLATAVEAALDAPARPVRGPLRTAMEDVTLSFEGPPSRQELESALDSENEYERRHARALLAELDSDGDVQTEYPYPVQAVGFGSDLTLLALAGEVLVDYSLRLKRDLPGPLWVAGYSNAGFTYVPTRRALHEGGYEAAGAITYSTRPGPLEPSVEERVVGTASALARRVGSPVDATR